MTLLRDIIGWLVALGGVCIFAALAFGAWVFESGAATRSQPPDSHRFYRYAWLCALVAVLAALVLFTANI